MTPDLIGCLLYIHARVIAADGHEASLEEREGLNCREVGGPRNQDLVTAIKEHLGYQIEPLLRTARVIIISCCVVRRPRLPIRSAIHCRSEAKPSVVEY